MLGRVILRVIYTHDKSAINIALSRGRDNDLLGATLQVSASRITVYEEAGGFNHDVSTQLAPIQVGGVALGHGGEGLAVNGDRGVVIRNFFAQTTGYRVVLQQVSQGVVVGQIIHADDFDIGALLQSSAEEVAANAAKTIDTYANGHCFLHLAHACAH